MKTKLISLFIVAVLGLFTLSACGTPAAPGNQNVTQQSHTISVTGSGIAFGSPDIAVATIGVHTQSENPSAAVSENTDKMNAVIAALKELGIEEKDIQTSNFSIYAQQNYEPTTGKPTTITYMADNSVTVKIRDLSKVGEALGQAVDAGANTIHGVNFTVSDQSKLEAEARDKAMADAKARAEQLARAAGVALGEPMTISEYSAVQPIPYPADVKSLAEGVGGAPVPVSTGQIQVSLQVSVTYVIK
jgi:hypothetical protein